MCICLTLLGLIYFNLLFKCFLISTLFCLCENFPQTTKGTSACLEYKLNLFAASISSSLFLHAGKTAICRILFCLSERNRPKLSDKAPPPLSRRYCDMNFHLLMQHCENLNLICSPCVTYYQTKQVGTCDISERRPVIK